MSDTLQKFMFEAAPIRGEFVELTQTWQQIQEHHDYPNAVMTLLGEMLAAAALLSANLKFNGSLIMQIHGDGPVRLLVVECDAELRMRATVKLNPNEAISLDTPMQQLLNRHGHGRFVITLDPKDKLPGQQPYQGIVPLDGDDISTVIENYMLRSEQLDTRLWLAANDGVARGLLMQKLPVEGGTAQSNDDSAESWNHLTTLAATLKRDEMLSTGIDLLMHRLFWEETLRVFEPSTPSFHCSCSRERVANMLRTLGQAEIDSALEELGNLGVDCDYCGKHYDFDRVDCAQLFATNNPMDSSTEAGSTKH